MEASAPKRYALLGRRARHSLSPRITGLYSFFTALEGFMSSLRLNRTASPDI